jgi:hypothetical protein
LTDSRADIKGMIRSYMAPAEAKYLMYAEANQLDTAVRADLIADVETACQQLVTDGKFERFGVIARRGETAVPGYRVADSDGELKGQGLTSVPMTAEDIARTIFPKAFRPPVRVYSRWEDAMIEQIRMYEFIASDGGRRYMAGFQASMNDKHPPAAQVPDGLLHALQLTTLASAEPVYVASEVCDLIDHARDSFQLETVRASDAFVPAGYCLLATPLVLHDIPGANEELVPVRAIAWTAVHSEDYSQGAFWISFYANIDEVPGHVPAKDWVGYPIFLAHMFQWQWNDKPVSDRLETIAVAGEDPDQAKARATEQGQLVQTLWRLAQQFVPIKQRAPRAQRREAQRKLKRQLDDVNIMILRRPSYDSDAEPSGRHLTVSFLVRGYWARRHTREGVRQVWVKPHVKGQGPFKETTRAWEFRR